MTIKSKSPEEQALIDAYLQKHEARKIPSGVVSEQDGMSLRERRKLVMARKKGNFASRSRPKR